MKEGIILRDKCPICNCASSKIIFNHNFNEELIKEYMDVAYQGNSDIEFLEDVNFMIVTCKRCNFSYQKYVLNEVRLDELYNKWINPDLAKEWNDNSDKAQIKQTFLNMLKYAKHHLRMKPENIRVLDYGAGFGDSLFIAKELGFDAYAYEYSFERIKILEEKGIKTIDSKSEIKFDFIISNQVLEHVTYPLYLLKDISSKLKEHGIIYISVPNCPLIERNLKAVENIKDAKELHKALLKASVGAFQHINFFTNKTLKLLVKKSDLKPILSLKQSLSKPIRLKNVIRPFYKYYFGTGLFLRKYNCH